MTTREALGEFPAIVDGFLLLGGAKLHLANHQPMAPDDEEAWMILDVLQRLCAEVIGI